MDKIVLLLPEGPFDIFQLFPALHFLHENGGEETELSLITESDYSKELSHLNFKIQNFVVDQKDLSALGAIKLAHKLDDLFNITHFVNLRKGVAGHTLGKSLKAKNRISPKSMMGKVVNTHQVEVNENKSMSEQYLELVQQIYDEDIENFKVRLKVNGEEDHLPENFFKSQTNEPFIFFALSDLSDDEQKYSLVEGVWTSLTDQKKILWTNEKNAHHEKILETQVKSVDATEVDFVDIHHYILNSSGVITDELSVARLCCYYGVDHFLISRLDHRQAQVKAFEFVLAQFLLGDKEHLYTEGNEELKEMDDISLLIDIIHEKFNL